MFPVSLHGNLQKVRTYGPARLSTSRGSFDSPSPAPALACFRNNSRVGIPGIVKEISDDRLEKSNSLAKPRTLRQARQGQIDRASCHVKPLACTSREIFRNFIRRPAGFLATFQPDEENFSLHSEPSSTQLDRELELDELLAPVQRTRSKGKPLQLDVLMTYVLVTNPSDTIRELLAA